MKNKKNEQENLLFLLVENVLPFLSGTLIAFFLLEITDNWATSLGNFILKILAYTTYYYLATPFIVYWLGYASVTKLTKATIILTICLVGVYSHILWDSYFFFKQTMQSLFVEIDKYSF